MRRSLFDPNQVNPINNWVQKPFYDKVLMIGLHFRYLKMLAYLQLLICPNTIPGSYEKKSAGELL